MSTADLHMAILPYDYIADAPGSGPSLLAVAGLVERLRAEVAQCGGASLLFDCGDFLQGSPMGDYLGLERGLGTGETHPMIAAMNAVGYDAGALGNHEFNYGMDFLEAALAQARFPVLCANLRRNGPAAGSDGDWFVAPRTVLETALEIDGAAVACRVGVFGLTPPGTVHWEGAHIRGRLSARPMTEAAAQEVAALRAEGADLVVALVHGGMNGDPAPPEVENQALPLARIDGIDVLLLGHTHEVFPVPDSRNRPGIDAAAGTIHGKPAVQPGLRASHLGVVDLDLERPEGRWRIRGAHARALPVPGIAEPSAWGGAGVAGGIRMAARRPSPDPTALRGTLAGFAEAAAAAGSASQIAAAAAAAHVETRRHVARRIGRSRIALHTFFAQIGQSAALRLIAEAKRTWTLAATAGTADAGLPVVAIASPFRSGGQAGPMHYTRVPPGELLIRHVHDLYEFPNRLRVLRMDGRGLAEWLERVAGLYAGLDPALPDTPLIAEGAPGYIFDHAYGVRYGFDLARPARYDVRGQLVNPEARRVTDLRLGERPLDPDAPILLVTNNYRAAGGGGFPGTGPGIARIAIETSVTNRSALLEHIRCTGEIAATPQEDGLRLIAPPGSSAFFDTCPEAAGHLDEIAAFSPEVLGLTEAGFLRLRLRF